MVVCCRQAGPRALPTKGPSAQNVPRRDDEARPQNDERRDHGMEWRMVQDLEPTRRHSLPPERKPLVHLKVARGDQVLFSTS